jgi:5-oxoprolinase (ATP-hydrolysing)
MSIAEEMGKVLQKISISTNIRERLDFSCGIFDWEGKLLANAPHLPVHLGSMETAVTEQIKRGIQVGDVVLTNHPIAGGSHLPDLTVVSCTEIEGIKMYLASRGHHADIGGLTPGSMPAFSKSLSEEGVAVEQFHLIRDNEFQ